MIKTYYFRLNEDGFRDWIKVLGECKTFVNYYQSLSNEMKEWNKYEYLAAREVVNQYKIFVYSLNKKQKEYWHKYIIKRETLNMTYRESLFIWNSLCENWYLVITRKEQFKSIDITKGCEVLKKIRIQSGYSIIQSALIAGISERTLQRYESGMYFPSLDILYKLLQIYGIIFDEFINMLKYENS